MLFISSYSRQDSALEMVNFSLTSEIMYMPLYDFTFCIPGPAGACHDAGDALYFCRQSCTITEKTSLQAACPRETGTQWISCIRRLYMSAPSLNVFGIILCSLMFAFIVSLSVYFYAWWNHRDDLRNRALKYMMFIPLVFAGVVGIIMALYR